MPFQAGRSFTFILWTEQGGTGQREVKLLWGLITLCLLDDKLAHGKRRILSLTGAIRLKLLSCNQTIAKQLRCGADMFSRFEVRRASARVAIGACGALPSTGRIQLVDLREIVPSLRPRPGETTTRNGLLVRARQPRRLAHGNVDPWVDVEQLGESAVGDDDSTTELEAGDLSGADELVCKRSGDAEHRSGRLDGVGLAFDRLRVGAHKLSRPLSTPIHRDDREEISERLVAATPIEPAVTPPPALSEAVVFRRTIVLSEGQIRRAHTCRYPFGIPAWCPAGAHAL